MKLFQKYSTLFDISVEELAMEEYQAAKKRLKENKAADPDNLTAEILKRCDFDETILGFANDVVIHGKKPDQWSILNIITVPEFGDLSIPWNCRGVSLSSIASKITNKLILNRIQMKIEPLLRNNQNGF